MVRIHPTEPLRQNGLYKNPELKRRFVSTAAKKTIPIFISMQDETILEVHEREDVKFCVPKKKDNY